VVRADSPRGVCPVRPSRTESLGVDGHLGVRIQRTVQEEASTRTQASAGREAVSRVPEQRAGAVDPGARWGPLPCPPPLARDLHCGALLALLVVCPAQVILT